MKFASSWSKKIHNWSDFIYMSFFSFTIHGDPTCWNEESEKSGERKKKKWKESDGNKKKKKKGETLNQ